MQTQRVHGNADIDAGKFYLFTRTKEMQSPEVRGGATVNIYSLALSIYQHILHNRGTGTIVDKFLPAIICFGAR